MDVWVEQPLQFHSNKALGPNNIINATDNLIEGLNLASVYTFKAVCSVPTSCFGLIYNR